MRAIIVLCLTAAVLWCGYWFVGSSALQGQIIPVAFGHESDLIGHFDALKVIHYSLAHKFNIGNGDKKYGKDKIGKKCFFNID